MTFADLGTLCLGIYECILCRASKGLLAVVNAQPGRLQGATSNGVSRMGFAKRCWQRTACCISFSWPIVQVPACRTVDHWTESPIVGGSISVGWPDTVGGGTEVIMWWLAGVVYGKVHVTAGVMVASSTSCSTKDQCASALTLILCGAQHGVRVYGCACVPSWSDHHPG